MHIVLRVHEHTCARSYISPKYINGRKLVYTLIQKHIHSHIHIHIHTFS